MDKKDKVIFLGIIAFVALTLLISYLQYRIFNQPPDLIKSISNFIGMVFFIFICYYMGNVKFEEDCMVYSVKS